MPHCKQAKELLLDLVEGHLPPELGARLHEHLDRCPPCLRLLETYRRTTSICRDALRQAVPADLADRIVAMLKTQRPK